VVTGLKHQKEKRSMDHFAGLDVSVKDTSVCIVDDTGRLVREMKVASEPAALLAVLANPAYHFKQIGLEAGPLSQWLFGALAEAGLPVICVETRHMRAVLKCADQQDRPQRRARHGADDAGGALSPGGYKLNFNAIWVLYVEGVIVVAAVGQSRTDARGTTTFGGRWCQRYQHRYPRIGHDDIGVGRARR
jgi:hypothetical protein